MASSAPKNISNPFKKLFPLKPAKPLSLKSSLIIQPPIPSTVLSDEMKEHFLEHGFVKVPECFTKEQADSMIEDMWTRLGFDPDDQTTWTTERTNMPFHKRFAISDFSLKAWAAICELLGGEESIAGGDWRTWSDGFIVNLGKEEFRPDEELKLRDLWGWHNDGDFFVHFLDSPEQALLVVPLWTDIVPSGGGTAVCSDGIPHIAKLLYDHPEGLTPWNKSMNDPTHANVKGTTYWNDLAKDPRLTSDSSFHEMTGNVGDVILMHPLMLHSASKNLLRRVRVITNSPVALKQPFCFNQEKHEDYSLVELKTLRDLGRPEGLKWWKITGQRRPWIPDRVKKQEDMRRRELERLQNK